MTRVVWHKGSSRDVQVIIGVDTHQDQSGGRHRPARCPSRRVSLGEYVRLCRAAWWARSLGRIRAFGIEGTGAGVARFLGDRDYTVVEVNRPDRSVRRRKGKSDTTDAEMAARSVLAGVADAIPSLVRAKSTDPYAQEYQGLGCKGSYPSRQIKALVVTAPAELRETLDGLTTAALITRCKGLRSGRLDAPKAAAKYALKEEVQQLETELERLTRAAAPALVRAFGVGPDTASSLLIAAGSNADRLRSEASFASLCGVNPIPASSGKTNRHRLNRGGDRQANSALYRIVVVRLRYEQRTQAYMRRRTAEGMTKTEVIRCLKRYVAREVYTAIQRPNRILDHAA